MGGFSLGYTACQHVGLHIPKGSSSLPSVFSIAEEADGVQLSILTHSFRTHRDCDMWALTLCDLCNWPLDTHVSADPAGVRREPSWAKVAGTLSSALTSNPASEHGSRTGGLYHRT